MPKAHVVALLPVVAVLAVVPGAADGSCTGGIAVSRNGEIHGSVEVHLVDRDGGSRRVTGNWMATEPAFSPDGRHVVVVRADGDYESSGPTSTALWRVAVDGGDAPVGSPNPATSSTRSGRPTAIASRTSTGTSGPS